MADLQKLLSKKQQLQNQIDQARRRAEQNARAIDTRRKILIGALMLERIQLHAELRSWLARELQGFLTRPNDRELLADVMQQAERSDANLQNHAVAQPEMGTYSADSQGL